MKKKSRIFRVVLALFASTALVVMAVVLGTYLYLTPKLPTTDHLKETQLQVPLRIYTQDSKLIGEFGEKKRIPVRYPELPNMMVKAVLSAEDDRFFEHPGVDYQGILRAAFILMTTGEKAQGGSTITMQVARNFFLSPEKTYLRKLNEILLSLKIERELSKEEILELYFNKIYFGNRAYGIASASQTYYGVPLDQLTIAQMAMLAGLPKAPSTMNPIINPPRALVRRNYVLKRMVALGHIDQETYQQAKNEVDDAKNHGFSTDLEAPYVAEMARSYMVDRFGQEAYTHGYKVFTTLDSRLQQSANKALRQALLEYDRRHGYRGAEERIDVDDPSAWQSALKKYRSFGQLTPALVVEIGKKSVVAQLPSGETTLVSWDGLSWARPYIDVDYRGSAPKVASDILGVGDIIWLQKGSSEEVPWHLTQIPTINGALVSLDPENGRIISLVGGFHFARSKFNRVTQAQRQAGSSFKPFIYSAALDKGFTAASLVNDAPVVFEDSKLESVWRPENYSGRFYGPTRLREALTKSRNLVSIRLLRSIGIGYTTQYVAQFGFDKARLPRNLSLALGSAAVTPLELANAYTVLANGGYRVEPYFVERIVGANGEIMEQAQPVTVCRECEASSSPEVVDINNNFRRDEIVKTSPRSEAYGVIARSPEIDAGDGAPIPAEQVVSKQNIWLITSMMRDVIKRGTGQRAMALGRNDLAGKTGTTNDQFDAWFAGFNSSVVTVAWVGFDQVATLGAQESGGKAALPMWVSYMRDALKGVPEHELIQPEGLVSVKISPETGMLASVDQADAIIETFREENVPQQKIQSDAVIMTGGEDGQPVVEEELF
ncbi:MAG: penicillin-binding protein 1A [Gammaproteobacteria bacterium]|nr:penicillin-binding protein 1A [Gammaproteobacteria bacterium]